MPIVTFPQSETNSEAAETVRKLYTSIPKLTALNVQRRLGGGYGGCTVYLARPVFGGLEAQNPWIIKVGPKQEVALEHANAITARSFLPPERAVAVEYHVSNEEHGLLVYSFAGINGRPPQDLEKVLKGMYAFEAIDALVKVVEKYSATQETRTVDVLSMFRSWVDGKQTRLPEFLTATASAPSLNSPDFGEAYSNPLHLLSSGFRHEECPTPFGFTHGDLNLRNVLFVINEEGRPEVAAPLFIDFRYSGVDQPAIVDLCKLEACLRYQLLPDFSTANALAQVVTFSNALRGSLRLSEPPEQLTDKRLLEVWKCLRVIREAAHRMVGTKAPKLYWAVVAAYSFTFATYENIGPEVQSLAFLDCAATLTRHFQPRDAFAKQRIVRLHEAFSPPVEDSSSVALVDAVATSLAYKAVRDGAVVLVVGGAYGRSFGYHSWGTVISRAYRHLRGAAPPPEVPVPFLLDTLLRRERRQKVVAALRGQTEGLGPATADREQLAVANLGVVLHRHFHGDVLSALRGQAGNRQVVRLETDNDLVAHNDDLQGGALGYVPLVGDIESNESTVPLGVGEARTRTELARVAMEMLARRYRHLVVVLWRCEDMGIPELAQLRTDLVEGMPCPVDCFFLSDQDNDQRDEALRHIDVLRVRATLRELASQAAATAATAPQRVRTHQWASDDEVVSLPDISRETRGLLWYFSDARGVHPGIAEDDAPSFLLGAPPTLDDIQGNRVVRRRLVDHRVLPEVRSELRRRDHKVRVVVLGGRPGAGVSTVLLQVAESLQNERQLVITSRPAGRSEREWSEAGAIASECSRLSGRAVVLVTELTPTSQRDMLALSKPFIEDGGELVVVIGGRLDAVDVFMEGLPPDSVNRLTITDQLEQAEWAELARILLENGFGGGNTAEALTGRLRNVGILLPAIYEATDRSNRKFKDIVAFEYKRYGRDSLIQRAYRMICLLGSFDHPLSQFWLLKVLGNRGFQDATRILDALSGDIVVEKADGVAGDVLLRPRHRIIAETVIEIFVPEPQYRLSEMADLIATANLSSEIEGNVVASVLMHRSPLMNWLREAYENAARGAAADVLFGAAIKNGPHQPKILIQIRQHYALVLRSVHRLEDALHEVEEALVLDPGNTASLHIAGLVHERLALDAWESVLRPRFNTTEREVDDLRARAVSTETQAADFFRRARDSNPFEEHGYEAEARYWKTKFQRIRDVSSDPGPAGDRGKALLPSARIEMLQGLALLHDADQRVPRERRIETPKTTALIMQEVGQIEEALHRIEAEIASCADPVELCKLYRVAAILSAEAKRWGECSEYCRKQLDAHDHSSATYLLLDDAYAHLLVSIEKRAARFRPSAEKWNRRDLATLLRWAEIELYRSNWESASDTLRRADDVCRERGYVLQREELRGILMSELYHSTPRRFRGEITRLSKPFEGFLRFNGAPRGLFFRADSGLDGRLSVGLMLEFSLAWRVRGLRAIELRIVEPS